MERRRKARPRVQIARRLKIRVSGGSTRKVHLEMTGRGRNLFRGGGRGANRKRGLKKLKSARPDRWQNGPIRGRQAQRQGGLTGASGRSMNLHEVTVSATCFAGPRSIQWPGLSDVEPAGVFRRDPGKTGEKPETHAQARFAGRDIRGLRRAPSAAANADITSALGINCTTQGAGPNLGQRWCGSGNFKQSPADVPQRRPVIRRSADRRQRRLPLHRR